MAVIRKKTLMTNLGLDLLFVLDRLLKKSAQTCSRFGRNMNSLDVAYFLTKIKSPPSSPVPLMSPYWGTVGLVFMTAVLKLLNSSSAER